MKRKEFICRALIYFSLFISCSIALVSLYSLALAESSIPKGGTLWSWGVNTDGQLGDGTTVDSPTPVQVPGLADIVEIVDHIGTKPGVYVLVSLWIDPGHSAEGWPTAATITAWETLAQTFLHYDYVLFGLVNEPESNFDGSQDAACWTAMNRGRKTEDGKPVSREKACRGEPACSPTDIQNDSRPGRHTGLPLHIRAGIL